MTRYEAKASERERNCRTLNLARVLAQGFRTLVKHHHLLRLARVYTRHLTWKLL